MTAFHRFPAPGGRVPWTPSELQRALAKSVVQQLAAERGINPIVASGAGRDPSHMAFRDAVIVECKRVLNIGNDKLAIVLGRDVGTIKKALARAGVSA